MGITEIKATFRIQDDSKINVTQDASGRPLLYVDNGSQVVDLQLSFTAANELMEALRKIIEAQI